MALMASPRCHASVASASAPATATAIHTRTLPSFIRNLRLLDWCWVILPNRKVLRNRVSPYFLAGSYTALGVLSLTRAASDEPGGMKYLLEIMRVFHYVVGITTPEPENERKILFLWIGVLIALVLIALGTAVLVVPRV